MEEIVIGKIRFTKWYLYQTSPTKDVWRRDCRLDDQETKSYYSDNRVLLIREKDVKPNAWEDQIARAPFFYRVILRVVRLVSLHPILINLRLVKNSGTLRAPRIV